MNPALIRQSVKQLREQHGFVGAVEHCFAPWYLHQRYHVPLVSAFSQSSDGNYDFGIDAYHLEDSKLILVQTKFTDGIQLIRSGFKELQRVLPEVARSFEGIGTEAPIQNMVLVNLRAALNRLSQEHRAELSIELQVVHLCELDEIILVNKVSEDMLKLSEAAQIEVPNHRCHIVQVGPAGLDGGIIVVPPEETVLRFQGTHAFSAGDDCRMITGIGQLATLVDLYRVRRDGLFSKNVRYFLNSKKNTDKGPAGKMRSTLKEMCIEEKVVPERFAAFHNGITIFARRAVVDGDSVRLRDPFVLNGCQTIKNAFMFRHEKSVKDRINPALWERVLVPVRIL
ncbi:MAG: AIPR family protein, partial [Planctomycetes bacterium]|nr:AIPR family protein [Planctomycetota bacterium]